MILYGGIVGIADDAGQRIVALQRELTFASVDRVCCQISWIGQLGHRKGLAADAHAAQAGRCRDCESAGHRAAGFGDRLVAIAHPRVVGIGNTDRRRTGNGGGGRTGNQRSTLDGIERTITVGSELIGLRIDGFDNAQQFDEGMPFIAALRPGACGRIFKQIVEVGTRLQGLGDCLEALLVGGDTTVGGIRRDGGGDFGIDPGGFTGPDSHFTTIDQRQDDIRALCGNHTFALANGIAHLEAAHVTGAVLGISLTGQDGNLGDDLGLGHDRTPHTD